MSAIARILLLHGKIWVSCQSKYRRPRVDRCYVTITILCSTLGKVQLTEKGQILKSLWDELSEQQSQLLELLNVTRLAYEG